MAKILLTHANIQALKSRSREQLPNVKSSHHSEALAAALGYRTHAALLADMKAWPQEFPRLGSANSIAMGDRLRELNAGDHVIDLSRMVREGVPDDIWRTFPSKDRAANEEWFSTCLHRNIPNVYLETRKKYWTLNWDCTSTSDDFYSHLLDDKSGEFVRKMFELFQNRVKNNSPNAYFDGSSFVGQVDHLMPETAQDIADIFFEILYKPQHRKK
ncbi:hypothetical protein [Parapedomonas caeni]